VRVALSLVPGRGLVSVSGVMETADSEAARGGRSETLRIDRSTALCLGMLVLVLTCCCWCCGCGESAHRLARARGW
jgi:hypothetical protein